MIVSKEKDVQAKNRPQDGHGTPGDEDGSLDAQGALGPEERPTGEAEPAADQPEQETAQLRDELEQAKDRALRLQAELENYRKRAARQMDEERRYANLPLMRDLLPVLDNIHRAVAAAEKSPNAAGLVEGFKMVGSLLQETLRRHQCERIEAVGKPFDPDWHEAVAQQPTTEYPPNTVVGELQSGFQLHGRVVRPTQVVVATRPPEAADTGDA